MTPDEAVKQGAMALFGEKYGDEVRVVSMGLDEAASYSTELCGGTHVHATGDIGMFKITGEAAVAAGIRRIEAVTRGGAYDYLSEQDTIANQLAQALKTQPELLVDVILKKISDSKKLEKDLAEAKKSLAIGGNSGGEKIEPEDVNGVKFISKIFSGLEPKELRGVADGFSSKADIIFVATNTEGKASIVIAIPSLQVQNKGIFAPDLIKIAVETVGGKGGGGRPEMAQGGGPDADKLQEAVSAVRAHLAGK
jgi:alanyl-tRNA synthetase